MDRYFLLIISIIVGLETYKRIPEKQKAAYNKKSHKASKFLI